MMTHSPRFINRKFEHALGAGREFRLGAGCARGCARHPLHQFFHPPLVETKLAQNSARDATFLTDQAQEQMLGADVVMLKPFRFLLSQTENSSRSLGKAFHLICHAVATSWL
jgi:hypothetical protein